MNASNFFAQGKSAFNELRNSIYREIREEFRERWADYYAAKKNGADPESLAARKAGIIAEQKALLDERRDEACQELRASRDERYRGLLDDQREARAELRWRQEAGLDNAPFLNELGERGTEKELSASFREAAHEVTAADQRSDAFGRAWDGRDDAETTSGPDDAAGMRNNFGHGLTSFFSSLAFDLINLGTGRVPGPPRTDSSGRSFVEIAAEEAGKQRDHRDREEEDERWRARQRSPHGD